MSGRGYLPGSPDFTSRLIHPGGTPRSAAEAGTPNYYARGRGEAGPTVRAPDRNLTDGDVQALALAMAKVLSSQIGMNVRQPSSNVPPFRAVQWSFDIEIATGIAATTTSTIFFSLPGNAAVALGQRGVIASLDWNYLGEDINTIPNTAVIVGDLRKNGSIVPGYADLRPGAITLETITDASGSNSIGSDVSGERALVPVKLEPGDTLSFSVSNANAVAVQTRLFIGGWFYPIEVQEENILGTVADRGNELGMVRRR